MTISERTYRAIGYHGTTVSVWRRIRSERSFRHSTNASDWLGDGVYFWQDAPLRAWAWAIRKAEEERSNPVVIRAEVRLEREICLLDTRWFYLIAGRIIPDYIEKARRRGTRLPNQTDLFRTLDATREPREYQQGREQIEESKLEKGFGNNKADRMMLNHVFDEIDRMVGIKVPVIRAAFLEGKPIFRNSWLFDRSHVQILVREPDPVLQNIGLVDENWLKLEAQKSIPSSG